MNNLLRFAIFLTVGTSFVAGWHYYLWARLVRDTEMPAPYRAAATAALVVLGVAMPLMMGLARALGHGAARPLALAIFSWMGLAFLLFFALLASDLVKLALYVLDMARGGGPDDPARRLAIARVLGGLSALTGLGAAAAGLAVAMRPRVERVTVPLRRLPAALEGLKIVQLSDVHIGATLGRDWLTGVVAQVNALSPDVVAITGDLVDGSVERLREHVAPLADLEARHGVYFVTGNHEYYSGAVEWVAHLSSIGLRVLRNERVSIGGPGASIDLAGVDDFSARGLAPDHGHDMARAMAGRDPSREVVLLAHQPRSLPQAVEHDVGLVLAGHTHGGQIFPWRYFVYLQQPIVDGLHKLAQTHIYVSRGTGFWGPPMRVGARGEITEVTLTRA